MTERLHFQDGGSDYARHRPTYPPALAAALASECARTRLAVDVGCGTGQLSVLLAAHFDRVIALDASPSQIEAATPHEAVDYAVGAAERIAVADGTADLVVAAQAAHWFDLDAFYGEARRIAAPGAVLALVSYGVPDMEGAMGDVFARFRLGPLHAFFPEGRHHVEEGYRSLAFPFAERALPPMVIERSWTWPEMEGYLRTWSATSRALKAGRADLVTREFATLAAEWGAPETERLVRWPVIGRLATLGQSRSGLPG